ncbi:MAG: zeta toxin family protein [Bacteroidetes bacterium]|nr:zeta toxin family protein [Bacteroidota bacterium]
MSRFSSKKLIASRPFTKKAEVETFLQFTLGLDFINDPDPNLKNIVARILDAEAGLANHMSKEQTMFSDSMRDHTYRTDEARWELRQTIIDQLWRLPRLNKDEDIFLGEAGGGALPNSGVKKERQAFFVIGLPASGKSGIAVDVAEEYGAIMIDSDFAKRKLPEFDDHYYGASIVHDESSRVTHGFWDSNPYDLQSLYELCIEEGCNIVIPTIGNRPSTIIDTVRALREQDDYEVHLLLVSLSKREATIRAVRRFGQTNRYVPIGLIFDEYANDPSHCYYYLQCKHKKLFKSMGVICT